MQTCNTLLVVDDVQINRMILRAMFKDEYEILEAENGEQGMALLRKNRSRIAAVLLDLLMPVKDGYEVLQEIEEDAELSGIPIVVITADSSTESEIRIFDLGASDIITKPFEAHAVKRRVKNAAELYQHKLHLEELVEEQAVRIRESNIALIDGLSSVIEHRSLESGQHIRRIRGFTKILLMEVAREHPEYGLDEHQIQIIADASSLHDIGKIAIPDAILNKPGKLTAEEFEIMKTHTVRGCEILTSLDRMQEPEYLRYAYHICRYHHERWDGKGYPDGLRENNIPICAQVVSVADCFDALTTDRAYKSAIPQSEAYNMILHGACGAFSPALMECFKNVQADFSALSRKYADDTQQHGKTELHTAIEFPPIMRSLRRRWGSLKWRRFCAIWTQRCWRWTGTRVHTTCSIRRMTISTRSSRKRRFGMPGKTLWIGTYTRRIVSPRGSSWNKAAASWRRRGPCPSPAATGSWIGPRGDIAGMNPRFCAWAPWSCGIAVR